MAFNYTDISDLGVAALNNSYEDIDDLIAAGCEVNYNGTSFSYNVVYDNDYGEGDTNDTADYEFIDVNSTTVTVEIAGITALDIAAYEGHNETVEKLLTVEGIEVDMVTSFGATPLTEASFFGFTTIISMLANAGADINHQDNDGLTPLHITSIYDHLESAKLLINLGAEVDTLTYRDGNTALIFAAYYSSPALVQLLVNSGATLDIVNGYNGTALDYALERNNTEVVDILILAQGDASLEPDVEIILEEFPV